jgi:hypothetical protein
VPYPHVSKRYVRHLYTWYSSYPGFGVRKKAGRTLLLTKTTNGTNLPNYKQVIKSHGDATNALTTQVDTVVAYPGTVLVKWLLTPDDFSSAYTDDIRGYMAAVSVTAPASTDPLLLDRADARALANFNEQLRKTSNAFSGGVFLGELREARDMLRNPAKSLFEGIGKYLDTVSSRHRATKGLGKPKKGRRNNPYDKALADQASARNIGKIAAESWLEYSFGWIPFISDIEDAFSALDNLRNEKRTVFCSAGGSADETNATQADTYGSLANYAYYVERHRCRSKVHVRYKGELLIEPQTAAADYAKNWGVHTSQFVPTAWELLPWSFLADYFGNIGDILNYDNSLNQKLIWCSKGTKREYTSECTINEWPGEARRQLGNKRFISSFGSESYAAWKRIVVTRAKSKPRDLTLSDITLKLPGLSTQWLNMAALLGSANSVNAQRFNRL